MGLFLTTCAGLVIWIVLWALGVKSFDAFLITLLMVIIAGDAADRHAVPAGQPAGPRRPRLADRSTALGVRRVCLRSDRAP